MVPIIPPQITYGIKKIGFNTIGAPNKIGSLIPNKAGINATRPICFCAFDLDNKHQNTSPNVTPVPVKLPNADSGPGQKKCIASFPACTAAMFSAKNCVEIGLVTGDNTDGWIPKKNSKQRNICKNVTANGLSIDPTNGAKIFVKIRGGIVCSPLIQIIRIIKKNPITITEDLFLKLE